jgi:hypothetical protein
VKTATLASWSDDGIPATPSNWTINSSDATATPEQPADDRLSFRS